jgi:hypothetical protein
MIIEMWDFDPLDDNNPYAMAQAARDARFTLKQAGDYTRHNLKSNVKSRGIISTDVELDPTQMANFRSRIMNGNKDVPIFTDGAGNVKYDPMQVDMDKVALDKINSISLEELLAVTGMSRTTFGIEVSGVTRDTSKVQYDQLVAAHTVPRIEWIIDALNQDYKKYYKDDAKKSRYILKLENPLGSDRDAEVKDSELRTKNLDLYTSLRNKGYEHEIAAKYAQGEITLEELGEPKNPPVQPAPAPQPSTSPADQAHGHSHDVIPAVRNTLDASQDALVRSQESTIRNAIIDVETQLVMAVSNKITQNAYDSPADIVEPADRTKAEADLAAALVSFYTVVVSLYANTIMSRRTHEFSLSGNFKLTVSIAEGIEKLSRKAALSHIDTVVKDLFAAVREAAIAGANQSEIAAAIRREYVVITKNRAKVIAKDQTNRAFTMGQYESDKQFLAQNDLTGRAYKKWITQSANPCVFCKAKAAEPPIPFDQPFGEVGDVWTATEERADGSLAVRKLPINYETIQAGGAHAQCGCRYILIIEGD